MYCFCSHLTPFSIETRISLIVHIREMKLTSNTAQFIQQMLPQNTHFDIRGQLNAVFDPQQVIQRPGRALFLYPDEKAQELNDAFKKENPGPYHLIIPDGNWTQARKVHLREEGIKDLPTVKLPAGIIGEYQLRKAPQPSYVSTFEACAHALGVLEGPEVRDRMMKFFRVFVKSVMHSRNRFHDELELSE